VMPVLIKDPELAKDSQERRIVDPTFRTVG
jgi:hypothetical protein